MTNELNHKYARRWVEQILVFVKLDSGVQPASTRLDSHESLAVREMTFLKIIYKKTWDSSRLSNSSWPWFAGLGSQMCFLSLPPLHVYYSVLLLFKFFVHSPTLQSWHTNARPGTWTALRLSTDTWRNWFVVVVFRLQRKDLLVIHGVTTEKTTPNSAFVQRGKINLGLLKQLELISSKKERRRKRSLLRPRKRKIWMIIEIACECARRANCLCWSF